MHKPDENFMMVSHERNYYTAVLKMLDSQNEDGSWGENRREKLTLTAHAIQLLHSIGLTTKTSENLDKSINWIKANTPKGSEHWSTRLELGIILDQTKLLNVYDECNIYIADLKTKLKSNDIKDNDIYWDAIPLFIAAIDYEEKHSIKIMQDIPHGEIIKKIKNRYIFADEEENFITIQRKPNNTGLIALYLSKLSKNKSYLSYQSDAQKMYKWLLLTLESEDENKWHWSGSHGITSYVLIDLIKGNLDYKLLDESILKIVNYIAPDCNGYVEEDKIKTFNDPVHGKEMYVCMLVLRAMTEVFHKYSPKLNLIKGLENMIKEREEKID